MNAASERTVTRREPEPRSASPSTPDTPELPDLATYVVTYARKRPDVAALWCFGVGFVLGWKLKPW